MKNKYLSICGLKLTLWKIVLSEVQKTRIFNA